MPKPLPVTVIVPVHNGVETLPGCLASILAQTRPPEMVIVVDDGSTDGSAEAARAAALPGLTVLSLVLNRGAGGARNAGASRATTEWLAFLDADDTWHPTFLEEICNALTATGTDFATTAGIREKVVPRRVVYRRVLDEPPTATERTEDFWRISWRQWAASPTASAVRRELFERVGGFPEDMNTGEDITLFARLWLVGRFCYVNRPLYTSVQRPTGLTARGPSYRDVLLMLARVGRCLVVALARRRRGSAWFVATYGRMVVGRHRAWLTARVVGRLRDARGPRPNGRLG